MSRGWLVLTRATYLPSRSSNFHLFRIFVQLLLTAGILIAGMSSWSLSNTSASHTMTLRTNQTLWGICFSCYCLSQLYPIADICITFFVCAASAWQTSPHLLPIRIQGKRFSDPRCRLVALLHLNQFYVANSINPIATCATDEAIIKYRSLRDRFESGNTAGDPWANDDSFGRTELFRKLSVAWNAVPLADSGSSSARPEPSSVSSVEDRSVISAPGRSMKRAYFRDIPHEEDSNAVKELGGNTIKY